MKQRSACVSRALLFLLFTSFASQGYAQTTSSWARQELAKLGIDPNNRSIILDLLRSKDDQVRFIAINFCGEEKIREALPVFKQVFREHGVVEHFGLGRSLGDRSQILEAVIEMEDTSFCEEFKMEIDSLQAERKGLDIDCMIKFSSYLAEKHDEDYGFAATYAYYAHIEEFLPRLVIVSVSYLKPFLTSQHHDELLPLLRRMAVEHPRGESRLQSLLFLLKLQEPQIENLLMQAGRTDSEFSVRYGARRILRDLNNSLYVTALREATHTETKHRWLNYELLIRTREPSAYRYVCDVLKQNLDPESNELIKLSLENPYLFTPLDDTPRMRMLDSLIAALPQISSYGWLADESFVSELGEELHRAQQALSSSDSIGMALALQTFQGSIDLVYKDSLNPDARKVTMEGWRFLYYSAQCALSYLSAERRAAKLQVLLIDPAKNLERLGVDTTNIQRIKHLVDSSDTYLSKNASLFLANHGYVDMAPRIKLRYSTSLAGGIRSLSDQADYLVSLFLLDAPETQHLCNVVLDTLLARRDRGVYFPDEVASRILKILWNLGDNSRYSVLDIVVQEALGHSYSLDLDLILAYAQNSKLRTSVFQLVKSLTTSSSTSFRNEAIFLCSHFTDFAETREILRNIALSDGSHEIRLHAIAVLWGHYKDWFVLSAAECIAKTAASSSTFVAAIMDIERVPSLSALVALMNIRSITLPGNFHDLVSTTIRFYEPPEPSEATVSPIMLDSLLSTTHQCASLGWLDDRAFVTELDAYLQHARQALGTGNSVGCARSVKTFQGKVDLVYRDSSNPGARKVTVEAWKFLHYNAQYILDRLPMIPPGSDSK